jgi:hypothetical protein
MEKPGTLIYAEKFAPSLAWVAASLTPFYDLIVSCYAGPQHGCASANEPEHLLIELEDNVVFRITAEAVIPVVDGDDRKPITLPMLWLMLRSLAPKPSSFAFAAECQ